MGKTNPGNGKADGGSFFGLSDDPFAELDKERGNNTNSGGMNFQMGSSNNSGGLNFEMGSIQPQTGNVDWNWNKGE